MCGGGIGLCVCVCVGGGGVKAKIQHSSRGKQAYMEHNHIFMSISEASFYVSEWLHFQERNQFFCTGKPAVKIKSSLF